MIFPLVFITLLGLTSGYQDTIRIGVILREGDEIEDQIINNVLGRALRSASFKIFKDKVQVQDAIHYHRAVCSILDKGVGVIITPTAGAYFPILASFSNEYNVSLIVPEMIEPPDDPTAPDLMTNFAVGIRPSTTRATLDLLRDLKWQEIVYIYDDDYGSETLQVMFRVGYTTLHLKVVGFAKVGTAQEANQVLKDAVSRGRGRYLHVILDTDPDLSRDILKLHAHHTGVRDNNYHFILTRPTLLNLWTSPEFRALKITGFLALTPHSNNGLGEWDKLLGGHLVPSKESNITVTNYYYHDAAMFLSQAIGQLSLWHRDISHPPKSDRIDNPKDCFREAPDSRIAQILKKISVDDGLTGKIQFSEIKGNRKNINLTIVQMSHTGYKEYGLWSDTGKIGGIRRINPPSGYHDGGALPQIQDMQTLRITTIISPPYMMFKKSENATVLTGNDRFEGFCKDIIDYLCNSLEYDCKLQLVEDGLHGDFDPVQEKWNGMIGEIIQARADLAVGDLPITGGRQRVVDFSDPFETASLSLLMKNPDSVRVTNSVFFVFAAFTPDVWVCIIVSAVLFTLLFHAINRLTSPPDSIESSSVFWTKKITIVMNAWFAIGSAVIQNTGVYPRSKASRILSVSWWFCTTIFTCLFIASLTAQLRINEPGENSPQLMQLKSLSLESILLESLTNGWPKVGIVSSSYTENFVQKSSLPVLQKYVAFLRENPDVKVSSVEEGVKRVRASNGGFMLLLASTISDYEIHQKPCDLLTVHDPTNYATYGFALSPLLEATLISNITAIMNKMQTSGLLGFLHRYWWIDHSQCQTGSEQEVIHGTLHSFAGLLCILSVGFLILIVAFGIQFSRRIQDKESRRQELTFDHRLPTPPPELLEQPPPVLDVPVIETAGARNGSERAESDRRTASQPTEVFKDFFERM